MTMYNVTRGMPVLKKASKRTKKRRDARVKKENEALAQIEREHG